MVALIGLGVLRRLQMPATELQYSVYEAYFDVVVVVVVDLSAILDIRNPINAGSCAIVRQFRSDSKTSSNYLIDGKRAISIRTIEVRLYMVLCHLYFCYFHL